MRKLELLAEKPMLQSLLTKKIQGASNFYE
jgi:hypothetical protein